MNTFSKSKGLIVYIIADQANINHRLKGIISLKESFEKMILVTRDGPKFDRHHITIRPYKNPLGLLRLFGLHRIKKNTERYLFFPSIQILYVWAAIKKLKKQIANDLRNNKSVRIITALPPHDLLLIGVSLKKALPKVSWIVDWQDLWSLDEYYFKRVPKLYANKLFKLEKRALTTSDLNVTTNENARAVLIKHHNIPPERTVAVNHHFYPPDFCDDLEPPKNQYDFKANAKIKIGFLGTLFKPPKVPGSKIVEVIQDLKKSGLNLELHIFGDNSLLARKAARGPRHNAIFLHPHTTHKQSLYNVSKCHFLLLGLSDSLNNHVVMHGKLPHYLLLKRPILAIVPKNSFVSQLINETGSGYVIAVDDNWDQQLEYILRNYSETEYLSQRDEKEIQKYSWNNISKQWLQVINHLTIV